MTPTTDGTRLPDASTRCVTDAARSGDLTVDDIVASLAAATSIGEVADCAAAVIYAGHAFTKVPGDSRQRTLSRLVADTRAALLRDAEQREHARIVAGHFSAGDIDLAYLATFPSA